MDRRASFDPDRSDPDSAPARPHVALQTSGASPPHPRRWQALALLCVAYFMNILDGTVVYVAMPPIERDLGFAQGSLQWVMTSYLIVYGGMLLLGGRAADLLGRRRVFMVGIALFVLSSLTCGLADSAGPLVASRAVQGLSAAIMTPTALALVLDIFGDSAERNKALGIWGAVGGIGATSGVLLGGPITDGLGWRWIFFINIPVGIALLVLTRLVVRESRATDARRAYDVAGGVTVTAALLAVTYAISEAPAVGWLSGRTLGVLAASVALFALFVVIERRSVAPLVPLRIFRIPTFVGGNLVMLISGLSVDGMLLIATLYAQQVLGFSPIQFGLTVAVMTVASIGGAMIGQAMVTKVGGRPVAVVAMLLLGASFLMLAFVSVEGSFLVDLLPGMVIFGPGLGAATVAGTIAAFIEIGDEEYGLGSGLLETSFSIGGALGLALLTSLALSHTTSLADGGTVTPHLLTQGYRFAFVAGIAFPVLGALVALTLLGGARPVAADEDAPGDPDTHDDHVANDSLRNG